MGNKFGIEFNNAVENVVTVIREARHMGIRGWVEIDINKFADFLHDVNFKMEFVDDTEEYVRSKMLDAMDFLKNELELLDYTDTERRVVNSMYDIIKEFYFNN